MSDQSTKIRSLRSCLIVPTLNRPHQVLTLLQSISEMNYTPSDILIVDSADDLGETTRNIIERLDLVPFVKIIHSEIKGITYQRNLGIQNTDSEIIHFIDDDTAINSDYFKEIEQTFIEYPDIIGISGLIISNSSINPSMLSKIFLISAQPGQITKSGFNSWITQEQATSPLIDVEWLTGATMSYRRSSLNNVIFDPRFSGYSLGEDLFFSLAISRFGRLVVLSNAQVSHEELAPERRNFQQITICQWSHRRLLVLENSWKFNYSAFLYSFFGSLLINIGKSIINYHGERPKHREIVLGHLKMIKKSFFSRDKKFLCNCRLVQPKSPYREGRH